MKIEKRNGDLCEFDSNKIKTAIIQAMYDADEVDEGMAEMIASDIESIISSTDEETSVDEIQDLVEEGLMEYGLKQTAKAYIIYRHNKDNNRTKDKKYKLLSKEFLSKYKHRPDPFPTELGAFVYLRTYSRWLPDEKRRERWWETVARAVDYNCSLVPTTRDEAEELYDNIYNMKQFLSGRTFWSGGTQVTRDFPTSNYNCAFEVIDELKAFSDLFYLLMVGAGVGIRILKNDVIKISKIRGDYNLINEYYNPEPKSERDENTSLIFENDNTAKIIVGDSKSGWVKSLDFFFQLISDNDYKHIKNIIVNYDNVRPKGERLKTFGGTASGHTSLQNMFIKINKIINKRSKIEEKERFNLKTIDCLDIANVIGENVVVGGVRRTSEIALIDSDDKECIEAKSNLYKQINGQWKVDKDLIHRQMSNNSIYYKKKPTKEQLHWQIEQMRYTGEPGFVNEEAGKKRRDNFNGVNPCAEILLDSKGLCNLTTLNVMSFVKNGKLNLNELLRAQELSAKSAYRMTTVELEKNKWDNIQQRDKLLGLSLTGWQDMVNATNMDNKEQIILLQKLREVANNTANEYAKQLGQNEPVLVTTVKPEGTLSQLPTVSSGVHYSHSPYYLRRVRINSDDPLVKVCEELEYNIYPEVGQDEKTCTTKVIEFPIKSPNGKTKYDVTAIEQLENYKMFMENYVDHNTSITIHVKDNEWEQVEEWVWNNWDTIVAVSFVSLDDSFYELMPYQSISKDEYIEHSENMKNFNPSLLQKYEKVETEFDIGDDECESGICPVR